MLTLEFLIHASYCFLLEYQKGVEKYQYLRKRMGTSMLKIFTVITGLRKGS